MKIVKIVEPFIFSHADGKQQKFSPGEHELEDDVADHWYVQAHSDMPPASDPKAGTPEYAQREAQKVARRKVVEAAEQFQADEQADQERTEQTEVTRRRIIADVSKPAEPD